MEEITMMKQITDQPAEIRKRKRADRPTGKEGKVGNKRKRKDEGLTEEAKQENIRRKKEITGKDVSFSKRRKGLFAKTAEFCMKFDHTQIAIVMLSRAQRPYAFGHPSVDTVLDHYLLQGSSPSSSLSSSAGTSSSVTGHALQQQMHKFEELKAKLKSRQDNETTTSSFMLDAVKEQIEKEMKACQTLQELVSLRQKYLVLLDNIKCNNSSIYSPLLEHHQAADRMAQYNNFATKPIIPPDEGHGNMNFNGAGGRDTTVNYPNLFNLSFSEEDHDHDHVISNDVGVPPLAANINGGTSYIRQKDPDYHDHPGNDINSGNGSVWDPDSIVNYLFDDDVEGAGCPGGAASDASLDTVRRSGFVQQNTDGVYSRTYLELEHLIHNPY